MCAAGWVSRMSIVRGGRCVVPVLDGRDRRGKCCEVGLYSPTSRNPFLVRFSALFPEDIKSVHTLTYWHAFYSSISLLFNIMPCLFPGARNRERKRRAVDKLDHVKFRRAPGTVTPSLPNSAHFPPHPSLIVCLTLCFPVHLPTHRRPLQSVSQHAQLTRRAYQGYSAQDSAANYSN